MKERDVIPFVMKHIRDVRRETCAVEVKLARGESVPFDAVVEHQRHALCLASGAGMYHKISDGTGQQTPFDAFCMIGVHAYVAVVWMRYKKAITLIKIEDWLIREKESKRKSITFSEAVGMQC